MTADGNGGARRELFLIWKGIGPRRIDTAAVNFGDGEFVARGASLTSGWTVSYNLSTSQRWITRSLVVRVTDGMWWRELELRREPGGEWTTVINGRGDDDLPAAEVADAADLSGVLDCDLGLCPLTNTMPVLRHGLVGHARKGVRETAEIKVAWVSVPSLSVQPMTQRYTSMGPLPGGGVQVEYSGGTTRKVLELDAKGFVTYYPGLAQRQALEEEP